MPTKLSDLIKTLAINSGVSADDAELTTILGNTALASLEVPDTISTRLTAPRLTMEAAKANPELKKHFTAQALDGVDAHIKQLVSEFTLPDDAKTEIDSEASTSKKVALLAKKIQATEAAKVAAPPGDKKVLEDKIAELNNQMASLRSGWETEKSTLMSQFDDERTDFELKTFVLNQSLNLPDSFDQNAKYAAVKTLWDAEMKSKGVKVVRKDGTLSLQTNEGTEYFDPTNNQKVTVNDFVLKTLANKGALKASTPPPTPPKNPQNPQNPHNAPPSVDTTEFSRVLDASLEAATK